MTNHQVSCTMCMLPAVIAESSFSSIVICISSFMLTQTDNAKWHILEVTDNAKWHILEVTQQGAAQIGHHSTRMLKLTYKNIALISTIALLFICSTTFME